MSEKKARQVVKKAYRKAVAAMSHSYSPYSKFKVGAAVVSGQIIFTGTNVENASYGATVCAERIAIFKGASEGKRKFSEVVVVTPLARVIPPCALCLQVMAEFLEPDAKIWLGNLKGLKESYTFSELLTHPFGPSYLK